MIPSRDSSRFDLLSLPALGIDPLRRKSALDNNIQAPTIQTFRYADLKTSTVSSSELSSAIFDNAASAKIAFSNISMHLPNPWRDGLFAQIDRNLRIDLWEDDSAFFDIDSFKSFLRFSVFASPIILPAIGIGPTGSVLAAWRSADRLVSVEFMKNDKATAVLTKTTAWGREAVSWLGHVAGLKDFVSLFGNNACLMVSNDG